MKGIAMHCVNSAMFRRHGLCFQARQQIAQLHTDAEEEQQHAAAAARAQNMLRDRMCVLEQVIHLIP